MPPLRPFIEGRNEHVFVAALVSGDVLESGEMCVAHVPVVVQDPLRRIEALDILNRQHS